MILLLLKCLICFAQRGWWVLHESNLFISPQQSIFVGHSDRTVGLCIIFEPQISCWSVYHHLLIVGGKFLFLKATISGFESLPVNPDLCNLKCTQKCNLVSMERHSVGVGFIKLLLVLVMMWQNSANFILGMEHQFLGSDNSNSTSSPSSVLLDLSYPNVKIGPYNWRYFRGKNIIFPTSISCWFFF